MIVFLSARHRKIVEAIAVALIVPIFVEFAMEMDYRVSPLTLHVVQLPWRGTTSGLIFGIC